MIQIDQNAFVLKQKKEISEIIFGIEGRNFYELKNSSGDTIFGLQEQGFGLWLWFKRQLFKSHRGLEIVLINPSNGQKMGLIKRPFYFFFSDIFLYDDKMTALVKVEKKFHLFKGKYDLFDGKGQLVGRVEIPFWRIWKFQIYDRFDKEVGIISKEWGGLFKEWLTDSDTLAVQFQVEVLPALKLAAFLTLVTLDFDYFEDNSGRRGIFKLFDN